MLASNNLTLSERLLIHRRRRDLTQTEAASAWGITEWDYRMRESGVRNAACPPVRIGKLELHEACFIMRRRAGMKRTNLAKEIGVSCWWLTQMERGSVTTNRLVEYWS